jgi:hypothetical protein
MFGNKFFKTAAILIITLACLSVVGCKKEKPAGKTTAGSAETTSQPSEQPQAEPKMPSEPMMPPESNVPSMPAEPNTPNEPNMSVTPAGANEPCEPNVQKGAPNQPPLEHPM